MCVLGYSSLVSALDDIIMCVLGYSGLVSALDDTIGNVSLCVS